MTRPATELIGREFELRGLAHAVERAAQGEPDFVLLLGEPGIGKTRLLRAARAAAEAAGIRTLWGTAIESGSTVPYLPLIAPLAGCLDQRAIDGASETVRRAVHGTPAHGVQGGGTTLRSAGGPDDEAGPARLVEAIFELLARRPTVLIVDDVQWADASTVTVLDYLAHRATDVGLAVILAARSDEPAGLAHLPIADGRRFRQVPIDRLTLPEVGRQVGNLLGRRADQGLVARVFARTAGNPFFVEQLLADDATAGTSSNDETPGALRSLILTRVDRLPSPARQVVDALAVIGRSSSTAIVASVAGLALADAAAGVDLAIRHGVVLNDERGHGFRHPLLGEVIAAELDGPSRQIYHRRAAETLTQAGAGAPIVAVHWWAAGDRARAWAASMDAAAAAARGFAFAEVRLHLEHALEVWPAEANGRIEALLRASWAAWAVGDVPAALEHARAARRLDPGSIDAVVAEGRYAWDTGDRAGAVAAFDALPAMLTTEMPLGLRARAKWGIGRARVAQGRFDETFQFAEASARDAAAAGARSEEAEAWLLAGMSRAFAGRIDGSDQIGHGLELALVAGAACTSHAYQFLVDLLGLAGRLDDALARAFEGVQTCDRLGLARTHGSDLRGRAALLLLELGRWDEAAAILEPAEDRAFSSLARGLLAMRRGERSAAESELAAAATGGSIGGPGALGGLLELARVELAWLHGDRAGAATQLATVPGFSGVWNADLAARKSLWASRIGGPAGGDVDHPDAAFAQAVRAEMEAAAETDPDRAAAAWAATTEEWAAAGRPYERAWTRLREAEARFAARDRTGARAALHEVAVAADRLGARPLRSATESLATRARVAATPTRRHRPDPADLTGREREVLALLAEGRTNSQVAADLFLSVKTVGIHVSRVLAKLGARTRGEAVANARRRGLLD